MLDHLSLQVNDVDRASKFYTTVFAPLGITELMRLPRGDRVVVGLGRRAGVPHFWLGPVDQPDLAAAREVHVAFGAASRAEIDQVHAAAVATGTVVLHPPQEWPGYHPGYYAVHLRDPDGNNVEAVWHGA